ncbi:MAG: zinc ribbon domain-containing protein [Nitrospinota bacterium]|nr:zinc ribbon domain-containing protein [Nitrospinota bacterium]MDH5789420.1 zinc ribbon domain-containing protein [Nitrospinota bacterium]
MPLYEYYCEDCQKGFTLLQSASVNKEETVCSECSSSNVSPQMSSFASKIPPRTGTSTMKAGPVTADELPNKSILNLPIPKHVSEYHN